MSLRSKASSSRDANNDLPPKPSRPPPPIEESDGGSVALIPKQTSHPTEALPSSRSLAVAPPSSVERRSGQFVRDVVAVPPLPWEAPPPSCFNIVRDDDGRMRCHIMIPDCFDIAHLLHQRRFCVVAEFLLIDWKPTMYIENTIWLSLKTPEIYCLDKPWQNLQVRRLHGHITLSYIPNALWLREGNHIWNVVNDWIIEQRQAAYQLECQASWDPPPPPESHDRFACLDIHRDTKLHSCLSALGIRLGDQFRGYRPRDTYHISIKDRDYTYAKITIL